MNKQDNQIAKRLSNYSTVSTELALLSAHRLLALLESATTNGTSTGCATVTLEIAGTPVFVKKIRLTDTERQSKNIRSTANLYGLPPYCQYGMPGSIGSPGFGVWRELAANIMTTKLKAVCQKMGKTHLGLMSSVLQHPMVTFI